MPGDRFTIHLMGQLRINNVFENVVAFERDVCVSNERIGFHLNHSISNSGHVYEKDGHLTVE